MDLNSDSEDGVEEEEELVPLSVKDDDCKILEVKQPVKRRKPKKIAQRKKRNGKPPPSKVAEPAPPPKKKSARKRYNSESEEAVSDTESEDDAAGKEGRLQRRAIRRIRNCITDPKARQRFDALPEKDQVLYRPPRARTQTAIMNITSHKSPVGRTPGKFYDETHAKVLDSTAVSSHDDTDEDYKEAERPPAVAVPPKKRKVSAESLPNKTESLPNKKSLQHILSMVSSPIHLPVASPLPPKLKPPATPPPKPPVKPVARSSWRRAEQAPQPVVEAVALGRPIHGDVGMLNTGPVSGALPRSLDEYVRPPPRPVAAAAPHPPPVAAAPHPPPAAHLLPSAPRPTWPALEWKRMPETPRTPSRYWNRAGPVVRNSFPQPSPPRERHDPRFGPRFGPDSDRRRCFDWRYDRHHDDRRRRW